MNKFKRLGRISRAKSKKEIHPKWSDKFIRLNLGASIEEIVSTNIRDEIIRDDIWLFMWTREEIFAEINISINRIKDRITERRLLAPTAIVPDLPTNVQVVLADLDWR